MKFELEIGDGIFYSIMSLILIGLFWLRYVEKYFSLWWIIVIWIIINIFIIKAITRKIKSEN
tara:strand:+ start:112 stop:297 length:186 start_codon:yes stop_codon:yes gene_type:complete